MATIKRTARKNDYLKHYLQWLRAKVAIMIPKSKRQRLQYMNVQLTEQMFMSLTEYREAIFITGDPQFPILKVMGLPNELKQIGDDTIDSVVGDLKLGVEDFLEKPS